MSKPTHPVGLKRRPSKGAVTPAPLGRGEVRRRAMLEAAGDIFLERGFEATTVGEVVGRSGGSLATLYAWFGSKEGLFEAIVAEISSEIVAPLDAPEFESRPLDEALRLFGERFVALLLSPKVLRWRRMCISEGPRFPALRAALLRTGPGRVRERLAAYLSSQSKAKRLRLGDPVVAAIHFFALVESETHLGALCGEPMEQSPREIEQQVGRAVDVFLHGYARPTEPDRGSIRGARRSRSSRSK